jgi:hypothetical protein
MNLVRWFRQAWPFAHGRAAVLAEYGRMRNLPLVMTDIGLRGGVWGAQPNVRDLYQAGWNEGRRAFALELFKIVKADPAVLFGNVPEKPKPGAEK